MTGDPALPVAVKLIAGFEGFRAEPYQDEAGNWAIGYGFSVAEDGSHVSASTPATTEEAAYRRLTLMAWKVLQRVRVMLSNKVSLNPDQAAALTSLAYNIGTSALANSTLMRLLNAGEVAQAANQFGAWVYDHAGISHGLQNRRAAEKALFLADDKPAEPPPAADSDALNLAILHSLNPTTPEG
jgi:lysozyme